MIARKIFEPWRQGESLFRWRGGDASRLESLSDAVYALALALLVVSLEVPHNFAEMKQAFLHLPAFAASFALLVMFWYYNYLFHRRFGLEDFGTVVLTSIQLFLVLFYVYPLKFLFTYLIEMWVSGVEQTVQIIPADMPTLMILYSLGFAGISLISFFLNLRAYRWADGLGLDAAERVIARGELRAHMISVGIALLSVSMVLISKRLIPWSGFIYFLMGPLQGFNGWVTGNRAERFFDDVEEVESAG